MIALGLSPVAADTCQLGFDGFKGLTELDAIVGSLIWLAVSSAGSVDQSVCK